MWSAPDNTIAATPLLFSTSLQTPSRFNLVTYPEPAVLLVIQNPTKTPHRRRVWCLAAWTSRTASRRSQACACVASPAPPSTCHSPHKPDTGPWRHSTWCVREQTARCWPQRGVALIHPQWKSFGACSVKARSRQKIGVTCLLSGVSDDQRTRDAASLSSLSETLMALLGRNLIHPISFEGCVCYKGVCSPHLLFHSHFHPQQHPGTKHTRTVPGVRSPGIWKSAAVFRAPCDG